MHRYKVIVDLMEEGGCGCRVYIYIDLKVKINVYKFSGHHMGKKMMVVQADSQGSITVQTEGPSNGVRKLQVQARE